MPEYMISGIPVNFPFEPYQLQKDYMAKVIECLNDSKHGVLESPTGTGKTLSLLCSTLAWVFAKKAQLQANMKTQAPEDYVKEILRKINEAGNPGEMFSVPKVIYASRTHSQLSQAMQELKNTSYSFMRAVILGSRDQLCIHPEVMKEESHSVKINLCKARVNAKVKEERCFYHARVEQQKENPAVCNVPVMDIEDLVKVGLKIKACPFFLARELLEKADIIFMPYNYLLDPKARKAQGLEISNAIIILDEAHNVEKMCEESASVQIKSSDIALSIEDITAIMKVFDKDIIIPDMDGDPDKDFSIEDLANMKEKLLALETAVDDITVNLKGSTFPGTYIFDLLANANITMSSSPKDLALLDHFITYQATVATRHAFVRKGGGIEKISDLLGIVFAGSGEEYISAVHRCYKVHVEPEEDKKTKGGVKHANGWMSARQNVSSVKATAKIVSFWCFNPGFGMNQLISKKARSIILTSGTLAPLKPLISELGIKVDVRLENPHIIKPSQVYVQIISNGPDKVNLCSNYQNRDNQQYISSLGRTILSLAPIIPDGLLVFFPSYGLLNKCKDSWLETTIWQQIDSRKKIFVEPRTKEEFNTAMESYYATIADPSTKGAIFMAVCRGKVSEGLDFADMNGRAVIITGLPFPPLMDPRIILKKKYLDEIRTHENEVISGDEWYCLEAARAVNQAIGRVIRHKDDYGAIILCDSRFHQPRQKNQLSAWIQGHLSASKPNAAANFGHVFKDLVNFYKSANEAFPCGKGMRDTKKAELRAIYPDSLKEVKQKLTGFDAKSESCCQTQPCSSKENKFSFSHYMHTPKTEDRSSKSFFDRIEKPVNNTMDFNGYSETSQVMIHKRSRFKEEKDEDIPCFDLTQPKKKVKMNLVTLSGSHIHNEAELKRKELLSNVKTSLDSSMYKMWLLSVQAYKENKNIDQFIDQLFKCFKTPDLYPLLIEMERFIKPTQHNDQFKQKLKAHGIL